MNMEECPKYKISLGCNEMEILKFVSRGNLKGNDDGVQHSDSLGFWTLSIVSLQAGKSRVRDPMR
jgi:hypothetical protein